MTEVHYQIIKEGFPRADYHLSDAKSSSLTYNAGVILLVVCISFLVLTSIREWLSTSGRASESEFSDGNLTDFDEYDL